MICSGARPEKWAQTLLRLRALCFRILVPGNGKTQRDVAYVDLLIESAESIVRQRDNLPNRGLSREDVQEKLGFLAFKHQ